VIIVYDMEDVGKRIDHLMALQDLWSTALCILTAGTYHSTDEMKQAEELEIALKILECHLKSQFNQTVYAKVINELPEKAEEIKDDKEKS
jgi:hypothetical protein